MPPKELVVESSPAKPCLTHSRNFFVGVLTISFPSDTSLFAGCGVEFAPACLWLPVGEGGWRDSGREGGKEGGREGGRDGGRENDRVRMRDAQIV